MDRRRPLKTQGSKGRKRKKGLPPKKRRSVGRTSRTGSAIAARASEPAPRPPPPRKKDSAAHPGASFGWKRGRGQGGGPNPLLPPPPSLPCGGGSDTRLSDGGGRDDASSPPVRHAPAQGRASATVPPPPPRDASAGIRLLPPFSQDPKKKTGRVRARETEFEDRQARLPAPPFLLAARAANPAPSRGTGGGLATWKRSGRGAPAEEGVETGAGRSRFVAPESAPPEGRCPRAPPAPAPGRPTDARHIARARRRFFFLLLLSFLLGGVAAAVRGHQPR